MHYASSFSFLKSVSAVILPCGWFHTCAAERFRKHIFQIIRLLCSICSLISCGAGKDKICAGLLHGLQHLKVTGGNIMR